MMMATMGSSTGSCRVIMSPAALSGGFSLAHVAMLLTYAILMLGVCLLACVVPTRARAHDNLTPPFPGTVERSVAWQSHGRDDPRHTRMVLHPIE
jgi:hypothetical protein